jgi:GTPase SAR1 family protein
VGFIEEFLEEYQPTTFEEYPKTETAKSGQVYEMALVDSEGQEGGDNETLENQNNGNHQKDTIKVSSMIRATLNG